MTSSFQRTAGLLALLAVFAVLSQSLHAQCAGDCTYWPNPGKFKVVGTTEVGPNGYPLIRVDSNGDILDDLTVEFINTKTPRCDLDPEDTGGLYDGVSTCAIDDSSIGDGLTFNWSVEFGEPEDGVITGFPLGTSNYQSSTGESILLRRNQRGVFSAGSGVYSVVRSFESEHCVVENACFGRQTSVKIDVEKVFTNEANTKICFDLAADVEASARAVSNQEFMHTTGADACGWHGGLSGNDSLPPTQELYLCDSTTALPSNVVVYGTNEFCDLQDYRYEKLGTGDTEWVEVGQSTTLRLTPSLIPGPGETVLIRARTLRNDIWSNSNTLSIVAAREAPEVTVTPSTQSLCILAPAAPFTVSGTIPVELPVTYQWQRNDNGTWRNIASATSSSYTPTASSTTEYRLRVDLDPLDPVYACYSRVFSNTVTLQRNDDATVYARDADGDGFPATDATGEIRILCEPIAGWVFAGLRIDCDDTDPDVHPENVWYEDRDQDGSPDLDSRTLSCAAPTPTSVRSVDVAGAANDCNDSDANVFQESLWYLDLDDDGFARSTPVSACNDPGPEYKTLEELASNLVDCDDENPDWNPQTIWYRDEDSDGFGNAADTVVGCSAPAGYFRESLLVAIGDCNDTDDRYSLRQTYYVDADGDGYPGLNNSGEIRTRQRCEPNLTFTKTARDLISVELGDCDDTDADVHPGVLWYPDRDGDGLGDSFTEFGRGFAACEKPAEFAVRNRDDCDDFDDADKCHVGDVAGSALSLDGSSLAAEITRQLGSFGTDDFTVELWVRTANQAVQALFSKGFDVDEYSQWVFGTREGRLYAEIFLPDGQIFSVDGATEIADGDWHHVVFRRLGQRFGLFVDGNLDGQESSSTDFDLTSFRNLWVSEERSPSFLGEMDEVRFWSTGRTTREIELTMHRTLEVDEPGLIAYWQMDEISDSIIFVDGEEVAFTTILDMVGGLHLVVESVDLVASGAPVGNSTSDYSEFVPGVTDDVLEFDDVSLSVEEPEIEGEGVSAVATEIPEVPSGSDPLPGEAAAQAHYILSLLEVGAQEVAGNAAAGVGQGQGRAAGGAADLVPEYTLYRRARNGDSPWEPIASTQTVVNGRAIFADVVLTTGQYYVKFEMVESPEGGLFRRGDSDASGSLELTDAVNTLSFLFLGGTTPPCMDAADVNDSANIDLSDAVSLLNYLFLGGPAPAAPGPNTCGPDPLGESLGCNSYENC